MTDAEKIARIQKLLALAGNNPSVEEAAAAWAKAQVMIKSLKGKPPSDAALRDWFIAAAAPCPWVIQVSRTMVGREYPAVVDAGILRAQRCDERLPTWRLVAVPLAYRSCDASEILAACIDGRIAWQAVEKAA